MIPASAKIFLANECMNHSKEVLVNVLPKLIRYRIPLYLPTERHIFNAHEILLEFKPKVMPEFVSLDWKVAKATPPIFTIELDGRQETALS